MRLGAHAESRFKVPNFAKFASHRRLADRLASLTHHSTTACRADETNNATSLKFLTLIATSRIRQRYALQRYASQRYASQRYTSPPPPHNLSEQHASTHTTAITDLPNGAGRPGRTGAPSQTVAEPRAAGSRHHIPPAHLALLHLSHPFANFIGPIAFPASAHSRLVYAHLADARLSPTLPAPPSPSRRLPGRQLHPPLPGRRLYFRPPLRPPALLGAHPARHLALPHRRPRVTLRPHRRLHGRLVGRP